MQPERDQPTSSTPVGTEQPAQPDQPTPFGQSQPPAPTTPPVTPPQVSPNLVEPSQTSAGSIEQSPIQSDTPSTNPVVTLAPDQPQGITTQQPALSDEPLHWQGAEYVHHEKDVLWFVVFGVVVAALMALAIFVIQSPTFMVLIPVMAAALIIYTRRPPRLIDYTLSPKGLYVNDQLYPFADFKGFGVIRDGDEYSIMLVPTKRFKLGVSIYFPEQMGESIVDMLGARLPMSDMQLDVFDRIIHKLRI